MTNATNSLSAVDRKEPVPKPRPFPPQLKRVSKSRLARYGIDLFLHEISATVKPGARLLDGELRERPTRRKH